MQETPRKQGFHPAIVLHSLRGFLHFGMGFLQQSGRPVRHQLVRLDVRRE